MTKMNTIISNLGKFERELIVQEKKRREFTNKKEAMKKKVTKQNEIISELREDKQETQKSIDMISLSVEEHEAKINELNEKKQYIMTGGGKNADLEIIDDKIAEEDADRSVLEDEMLELWQKIDDSKESIEQASDKLSDLKEEVAGQAHKIDKKIKEIDNEIEKISEKLKKAEQKMKTNDPEAHRFYKRLQKKSVRPSAVPIKGDNCSGCYFNLPPDTVNKILEGKEIIKCPNCYRFLYFDKEKAFEEIEEK